MPPSQPSPSLSSLPRRGRRGKVEVLMIVMISGLIVTISSFLLLNMFVTQATEYDRVSQKADLSQMIEGQIHRVQQDVQMVMAMMKMADPGALQDGRLVAMIAAQKDIADRITSIFWIPGSSLDSAQGTQLYPPQESSGMALSKVIGRLKASPRFSEMSKQAVLVPATQIWQPVRTHDKTDEGTYRHIYDYLALAQPDKDQNGVHGYVVVVFPAHTLVDSVWRAQKTRLDRLALMDSAGVRLYDDYRVNFSSDPDLGALPVGDERVMGVALADPAAGMRAAMMSFRNYQDSILVFIPYFALGLGLLLTIFGSYYVHNNHAQSDLLLKMNRTLALKNMEMNSQVIERERLNQILRKTERENRAIIDSVSDIIFELDENGRFLFVNETWQKILDYPPEQAEETNLFDLMPPADSGPARESFTEFVQGQREPFNINVNIKTAYNTYRMMEIKFSMRRTDESQGLHVVGTMTDIEERRRAEAALMEAEQRYRSIWENAPSGIYQVTADGKLLSANPAFARIFGYENPQDMIADVVDMPRQLFPSPKERQITLRKLTQDGVIVNQESQAMRRDRQNFWMLESARVVKNEAGEVLYFEGSVDDVTERKDAEIKLKDAMLQSELANRSKTEFLANMSHELRTPLNAIIGFSEMIKDQVYGAIEQQQYKDYAKDIHDSGKNLLNIINTILDVARIEAGERQLNEALINIPNLIQGVIDFVRPKVAANEQRIQFVMPGSLPRLLGEEQAVRQILLNLLSNAIKFTPTGGQITVKADMEGNGDLTLAVSDTGVGLDADEIARVMAPFGLASGSFARSSSGPGLGLTLVHSLTKLHGGRFEMISQKGVGTTAMVTFPAVRMKQAG